MDAHAARLTPQHRTRLATILAGAALGAAIALGFLVSGADQWQLLGLFIVLLVLAVASDLLAATSSAHFALSGTFMAVVLAAVLLGPVPAAVIGVASMLVAFARERHALYAFAANIAIYAWLGLGTGLLMRSLEQHIGAAPGGGGWYGLLLVVTVFGVAMNFILLAPLIALARGVGMRSLVREDALPFIGSELASVLLVLLMAAFYVAWGVLSLGIFALALIAYQNLLQLFLAERERARSVAVFGDLAAAFARAPGREAATQLALQKTQELLGAEHAAIYWQATGEEDSQLVAARGLETLRTERPPLAPTVLDDLVVGAPPVAIERAVGDLRVDQRFISGNDLTSLLVLGLSDLDRRCGTIVLGYDRPTRFDLADLEQARQLGEEAGLALGRCELIARLDRQSRTDALTELMNRRALEEALQREVARSDREETGLGMLVIDLDGLKRVNDTLGHPAGDELLVRAARLLERRLRSSDLVGRWGGDEFVVVCPGIGEEALEALAEMLETLARAEDFSLSVGRAARTAGESALDLTERADLDLYQRRRLRQTVRGR